MIRGNTLQRFPGARSVLTPGSPTPYFPWASADLNFATDYGYQSGTVTTASALISTTRGSTAYAANAAGVYSSFSSNVPRITDLGLLVEESRTNSIANNSMQGGVAGTPGTLPTGWSINLLGCSQQIVGIGTSNGIDYIDLRIFGSPSSTTVLPVTFSGASVIAASAGQVWTESVFLALVGGDFTNVASTIIRMNWQGPGSNSDSASVQGSLTSTLRRFSYAGTAPATTTFVLPRIGFNVTSGQAIDFTLRIGWPQMELGAFATSPIRTTSGSATRAADTVTLTTNPVSGGTWSAYVDATEASPTASTRFFLGETNNNLVVYNSGTAVQSAVFNGTSVLSRNAGSGGWTTGCKVAVAADGSGRSIANNNSTINTDANTQTFPTTLYIGARSAAGTAGVITFRRMAIGSTRLDNNTIRAITI